MVRVSGAKHNLPGVSMMEFNPSVRRTAALGQLEKHADLAIEQWKRRLLQRADGTHQTNKRYSARMVRIGLYVLAEDKIANCRMHLIHPATSKRSELRIRARFRTRTPRVAASRSRLPDGTCPPGPVRQTGPTSDRTCTPRSRPADGTYWPLPSMEPFTYSRHGRTIIRDRAHASITLDRTPAVAPRM